MVLTRRMLRAWDRDARLFLGRDEEDELLRELGSEPDDVHTYTEQDLYEQGRKILRAYREGKRRFDER